MTDHPIFICVIWQKARMHEAGIRTELARSSRVLHELELQWSRRMFRRHIRDLFGMTGWLESWRRACRCGYGPFKVLVLEGGMPDAASAAADCLRRIAGCPDAVYISLTGAETDRSASVLLGVGMERWLELVRMVSAGGLEVLGSGARRTAYRIPGTDLCLKSYVRSSVKPFIMREVSAFRFNADRNTCAQEGRYYRMLRERLPVDLSAVFPKTLELVALPEHGWSLVEERIANADGSIPEKFASVYRAVSPQMRARLLSGFQEVMDGFVRHAIRFYDSQNILVQWLGRCGEGDFRLRVVDFEPVARTFIPLDSIFPALVRSKVRRRACRYLKRYLGVRR